MDHDFVANVICPGCGASVEPAAVVCPGCGSPIAARANTLQAEETSGPSEERVRDQTWFIIVILLHLGVLGVPFYMATRYSLAIRLGLVIISVLYTAFVIVFAYFVVTYIGRQLQML